MRIVERIKTSALEVMLYLSRCPCDLAIDEAMKKATDGYQILIVLLQRLLMSSGHWKSLTKPPELI